MSKPLRLPTLICAALCLLSPAAALGQEGDLTAGLGPSWSDLPTRGPEGQWGLGGQLHLEYRLGHFWGLTTGGAYHYQLGIPKEEIAGQHIGQLWAGVLYNLDVATYVPFATLSATAYLASPSLTDPEGQEVHFGARGAVGVDVRRYRHFSYGVEATLHAFATDLSDYPVYLTLTLRLNYHTTVF